MLPPAAERPKLRATLDQLSVAVEELLLGGLTTATDDTRRAMGDLTVDNLLAHFAGKPLLTPVI